MIALYYGGFFIPGFLIDLLLLIVAIKSISVCYTNKKVNNQFVWFWVLTVALIVSIFSYGTISNLTLFFIYFTVTPILILCYGVYIIKTYEKE